MAAMEKGERIQSHIPYPELYAPEAVDLELTKQIMGVGETPVSTPLRRGALVTPIDLRRTPNRLSDDEILEALAARLGVEKRLLTDAINGARGDEREKVSESIRIALEKATHYLKQTLGIRAPNVSFGETADLGKNLVALVRETSRYRESYHKGLQNHAAYCALVSVGLAVFELQKKEAHALAAEMAHVEAALTQPTGTNAGNPLFHKYYAVSTPETLSVTIGGLSPQCRARVSMRDKSLESQITKYMLRPETTADSALKDVIGVRIEVRKDRVEEVLIRTLNYIQENLGATRMQIEDRNLLGTKRLDMFKKRKTEEIAHAESVVITTDTSPLSADSFRVTKIIAMIETLRGTPPTPISRALEIQIVEPENKNESGLSSHAVYELKKHITVMTRLFGGCNERWLKERIEKIAEEGGYDHRFVHNTLKGLQDVGFLIEMPNVPNKKVYAATDVYRRWLRVDGLITDPKIRQRVLHKLGSE